LKLFSSGTHKQKFIQRPLEQQTKTYNIQKVLYRFYAMTPAAFKK